ncbi:MAG: hypothetical protein GY861_05370 [bacterium]|nr:hypothetical protein [bacterium]
MEKSLKDFYEFCDQNAPILDFSIISDWFSKYNKSFKQPRVEVSSVSENEVKKKPCSFIECSIHNNPSINGCEDCDDYFTN